MRLDYNMSKHQIKKRIITALLVLGVFFAWNLPAGTVFAADTQQYPKIIRNDGLLEDYTDKTVVLQSNDVHGRINGYQYMAGLRDELRKRGADVILVDCGDYIQGSKYVSGTKGESAIRMMNKVGYDLATLGNHEFDYSYTRLRELLSGASFDIICNNILNPDKTPAFAGTKLVKGDVNVGFVGIDTPETQTKTSPSNLEGMNFLNNKTTPTIYDQAQKDITDLKANGADVVLALAHLGVDAASSSYMSYDLWKAVKGSGLDYILDGHSHTVMTEGNSGEPIIQTGSFFLTIGVITIDEKTGKLDKNAKPCLYKIAQDSYSNAEVKAESDKVSKEIDEIYSAKVGSSEVDLTGARNAQNEKGDIQKSNKDGETNAGDFSADAIRWYALKDGKTYDVPADHIVGLYNGGAIRENISKGDITRGDVLNVYPFANSIEGIYVKGSQLLEALEASTFIYPNPNGGFPHVAGMEITIDPWKKFVPAEDTYPASSYYPPASIERVTIDSINGKPFSADDTYLVATSSFIAEGGDTYGAFQGLPKISIANLDEELFCDYIRTGLGGTIDSRYAEPQGRLHIVEAPPEPISIENTEVVLVKPAFVYNGEVQQPQIVTIDGRYLIKGKDYSVKLAKQPKNVGTYTMTIQGKGNFTGKTKATFRIRKADNSLQVTGKTATVKYKKLKKNAKVLKASKVYDFTDPGEGSRTYKLISAAKDEKDFTKAFKVNAKNGKVIVRRKTKKGTYDVTVKVKAKGNDNYKPCAQTVTCQIEVRP